MNEILLSKGYETKLLHINAENVGDFKILNSKLKDFCKDADLIGFSCMTNTFLHFAKLSKTLKELGKIIIVGGLCAKTINPF